MAFRFAVVPGSSSNLDYKGTWDADTNTPELSDGSGETTEYYIVSVAGTTTLDGISTWNVGDWVVSNGTEWQRVETEDIAAVWGNVTGVLENQTDLKTALYNLANDLGFCGFTNDDETSVSFDDSTYTLTLADAGAGWSYWRSGYRYTITGNKTVTLPGTPPDADKYFIYIDATDGTLSASTSSWTITDGKVPVATIDWNNTLTPKYLLADERHTSKFPEVLHKYEHLTLGTRLQARGAISGYTLDSDVLANKQYDLGETDIWDEDLQVAVTAITGGTDNYHIFYRTAAETWVWKQQAAPFSFNSEGSGYIDYDTASGLAEATNNDYVNTFVLATNYSGLARYSIILGQNAHSTLARARQEDFIDLDLTGLDIAEAVAIWRITWRTNASFSTSGKCVVDVAPKAIGVNVSTQSTIPGLGTMSTQDADNVEITGGTINGIAVTSLSTMSVESKSNYDKPLFIVDIDKTLDASEDPIARFKYRGPDTTIYAAEAALRTADSGPAAATVDIEINGTSCLTGVITPNGSYTFVAGTIDTDNDDLVDGDTVEVIYTVGGSGDAAHLQVNIVPQITGG